MADIAHWWGNDISVGPTGDIAMATGSFEVQQRIIRSLMTNKGDYIWHLGYGAGLPAMVGQPARPARIAAIIRAQVLQDNGVARSPPPKVTVTATPDGTVTANIIYTDAATGSPQTLKLPSP